MTYCAGWRYGESVHLIADTAVTKNTVPQTPQSSFGQLHARTPVGHVEEALCKLVPIGSGTVIAYAGDVELATTCVEFLRSHGPSIQEIESALHAMAMNLGPFSEARPVELLIAMSTESGGARLIRWDSENGSSSEQADFYQIGSLTSYHAALTPALLAEVGRRELDARRMLCVMSAVVQSYGVHDNLIDQNVGGLIFGVETKRGEVTWQPDTNFVLYSPDLSLQGLISAMERDNALVVASSLSDDIRVMAHSASMPQPSPWTDERMKSIRVELDSELKPLWVFVSTLGRVITIIFRTNMSRESSYVKLANLGGGKFDLAFSPALAEVLRMPLVDRGDGSLPFRLNVKDD